MQVWVIIDFLTFGKRTGVILAGKNNLFDLVQPLHLIIRRYSAVQFFALWIKPAGCDTGVMAAFYIGK